MVIPFPAGGAVDLPGRLLGQYMARTLGQPIVVENRPGATGTIGTALVARAPKDGYTVLLGSSATLTCSFSLHPKLNWNPLSDFEPIGMVTSSPLVITVPASLPVKTLPEFITYLKQNPGKLNYSSSGVGSMTHIAAEMFLLKTDTKMVHVPYKGTIEGIQGLLSGQIQSSFSSAGVVMPFIRDGKLKALAVMSMTRDPMLPDVPTLNESGVPDFDLATWTGLFVPAGTSSESVARLTKAMNKAFDDPDFKRDADSGDMGFRYLDSDAVQAKLHKEVEACSAAISSTGIRLE